MAFIRLILSVTNWHDDRLFHLLLLPLPLEENALVTLRRVHAQYFADF
jgi:hypothetical protein